MMMTLYDEEIMRGERGEVHAARSWCATVVTLRR